MRPSQTLEKLVLGAKSASAALAPATTEHKNRALLLIAGRLEAHHAEILEANRRDLESARALHDRLSIQGGRFEGVVADLRQVATLADPVGEILEKRTLPNGLLLQKVRVPIGVLGVIYEARPNVTIDVTALALKTGNCALLRGGSDTLHTNKALALAIKEGLAAAALPQECIQLIGSRSRTLVKQMLKMDHAIDMIIPRGGQGLHRFCLENSTIPVITGGMGICHLFVDSTADQARAIEVIINAKVQRPTVCNALDTLLVDERIAPTFLPKTAQALATHGVSLRLDPRAGAILGAGFLSAEPQDWKTEWLSLTLGIKVVRGLDEAIDHIRAHGTGHSDGILTETPTHAEAFVKQVDSASVYVNASTRFTDGAQFGLGAEVAVSTQKLHARGPMGLAELTTYKWIVKGNYHTRG